MMSKITGFLYGMRGRQDLALIAILLTSVIVMIIPMPTVMIDVLIAFNISLTMLILIVSVYIDRPTSFSTFPAIILIATTFRLAISISTTRTVLTTAEGGAIIETFGNFVTGGNIVVGLVIFLIITIVQFVVITKGAERVAEVAARFVLDALPGRQLSIDAELRAGDITPDQARTRRRQLDKENQFFGAMDGAMKFVKGDAIAGLLIIAINLIGGIAIGTTQLGMPIAEAGHTFSLLSIGDGLVAQIPALLLALCAGAVVTRVTTDNSTDLGASIAGELIGSSRALYVSAGVVACLGFVPGFPTIMFLIFGGLLGWMGFQTSTRLRLAEEALLAPSAAAQEQTAVDAYQADSMETVASDRVGIRVGAMLGARVDASIFVKARADLRLAQEARLGVPMPRFGLRVDETLAPHALAVDLDRVSLFSGVIPEDAVALVGDRKILEILQLPSMEIPRHWRMNRMIFVREMDADAIRDGGMPVLSPAEILVRLTGRILEDHAGQIVGYDDLERVMGMVKAEAPQLAEQASKALNIGQINDILRRLVDEKVPLGAPRALFEALVEWAPREQDNAILTEHARRGMRRQLCNGVADRNRVIAGYIIEPGLEDELRQSLRSTEAGIFLTLPAALANSFLALIEKVQPVVDPNAPEPVIVTSVDLRRHVSAYLKSHNMPLTVMSFQEVAPEFQVQPVGTLSLGKGGVVEAKAA